MSISTETDWQAEALLCISATNQVDLRRYETLPPSEMMRDVVPPVLKVVADTIALARKLIEFGDVQAGIIVSKSTPQPVGSTAYKEIADVAFIGVLELEQKLRQLEHLTESIETWTLISECGSALRRCRATARALERAIAKATGKPSKTEMLSSIKVSLEVRRQYQRLRSTIQRTGRPADAELVPRLRSVGTAIAMLIGREVYPELRVRDRRQIRDLQARILEWLRDPNPARGQRLWQDLDGFARLIGQVSRRQELVEHDLELIGDLLDGTKPIAPDSLRPLVGRDDAIDDYCLQGVGDTGKARDHLFRLREELLPGSSSQAPPPSFAPTWPPDGFG